MNQLALRVLQIEETTRPKATEDCGGCLCPWQAHAQYWLYFIPPM